MQSFTLLYPIIRKMIPVLVQKDTSKYPFCKIVEKQSHVYYMIAFT